MAKYLCEGDMNTGEYISRDEILKAIHSYCENCDNCKGAMCRACDNADNMDIIIDIPAADVQPVKRGKWENIVKPGTDDAAFDASCSCCHKSPLCDEEGKYLKLSNYCPHCGAKMSTE